MISIRVKFRPSTVECKEGVVYYQLIKNGANRQITTAYKLYPREWDAQGSIININGSAYHRREHLQNIEMRIMRDLSNIQRIAAESNDIEAVIKSYAKQGRENSLFRFASRIIEEFRSEGRTKTALSHKTAVNSFSKFRQGKDIAFDEFKPFLMKQYEQYLKAKSVCNNTISFYMRILRALYNRAVEEGYSRQCFPFKGVYVGIDKTVKRAVDGQVISGLRALDLSKNRSLAFARDMFMFSFYTRGMAFVDVAHLTKANIRGEYVVYQRHKTGQELSIKIEPCLKSIITRYEKSAIDSKYLLPILARDNSNYESALRLQNMRLKAISKIMNLSQPLTSYVARHSWATLAKRKGIPTQIISESMGHNNEKTTLIYLSSLDRSVIDRANAKLLSII